MKINPEKVISETNDNFGLEKYSFIINRFHKVDVSKDIFFQTKFNGFYRVRRGKEWRKCFYELFEKGKTKELSFREIIIYLYEKTGNVEASFSSKMLATLNPDKPIWDQYILKNLNFQLVGEGRQKLNNAIFIYSKIENWYKEFLKTPNAKECIEAFDKEFPMYQWLSDIKKIDCFLWKIRD